MCGITGFFGFEDSKEKAAQALERIHCRGFDSENIVTHQKCSVAHCLHAINGFVPQPFGSGNYVFLANCEIYNWKQLERESGMTCRNDADLLFNFVMRSKNMESDLEKLDGVYAFCLWNTQSNKVTLARDIIGEKPLWYYHDESGRFAFASERKALVAAGLEKNRIEELNPRKIISCNVGSNKLSEIDRKFFETKPEVKAKNVMERLNELLVDAVKKRIPKNQKLGLLLSGGIDSVILAFMLKRMGVDFTCYTAVIEGDKMAKSEDAGCAEKIAEILGINITIIRISVLDVERYLKIILPLIEDNNVVKAGVALPMFMACEHAKKDGIRVMFSGLGSDEIFAGYNRQRNSNDLNQECVSYLRKSYEKDLYRDDVIAMFHTIELRLPFMDTDLVKYALRIPADMKINTDGINKHCLRELASELGIPEEFAFRKKKAAQYGGNFDKAISILTKKEHKTKSEYLKKFFNEGNVRIASLWSTGKDSALATQIMLEQNYDVACFITLVSENEDSYMYHGPNTRLAELHAEAAGKPIIIKRTKGEKEKELEELKEAISEAKKEHAIGGIVTGALFSDYQRQRIERICDELGIKCFSPLWHMDQEKELEMLLRKGFEFMLVKIAAEGLGKEWLGKKMLRKDIEELVLLSKKRGINPAGEGGEYESFVLRAPFFKGSIVIRKTHVTEQSGMEATLFIDEAHLHQMQ